MANRKASHCGLTPLLKPKTTMKQKLMNLEERLYRMEKKIDEAPLERVAIIAIAILAVVEAYLIH